MTIGKICRALREDRGWTQGELARRIGGIKQQSIQQLEDGTVKQPRYLNELASAFGITLYELLAIDPQKRGSMNDTAIKYVEKTNNKQQKPRVPIVGNTQAGPDKTWMDNDYPAGSGDGYLVINASDPNAYGLKVVGSSMSPRMREGEIILVFPNTPVTPGDDAVIRTISGEIMVKTVAYIRGDEVALDSMNHERIIRKMNEIDFLHFVAGVFSPSAISPD